MSTQKNKKDDKTLVSLTAAILPAVIAAVAGIIASYLSYRAGFNQVSIPIAATQTAQALTSNINGNTNFPIAIDSQKYWQSTGFRVMTGDVIMVEVIGGKWSGWRDEQGNFRWEETDGYGFSDYLECGSEEGQEYGDCPVKQSNVSALVGRIGSTLYSIGRKCTFRAGASGVLELTINDDDNSDNSGVLAVKITNIDSPDIVIDNNCGLRSQ